MHDSAAELDGQRAQVVQALKCERGKVVLEKDRVCNADPGCRRRSSQCGPRHRERYSAGPVNLHLAEQIARRVGLEETHVNALGILQIGDISAGASGVDVVALVDGGELVHVTLDCSLLGAPREFNQVLVFVAIGRGTDRTHRVTSNLRVLSKYFVVGLITPASKCIATDK